MPGIDAFKTGQFPLIERGFPDLPGEAEHAHMVPWRVRASVVLFRTDAPCRDRKAWQTGNGWIGHVPREGMGENRKRMMNGDTSINFRDSEDFAVLSEAGMRRHVGLA